MKRILLCAYVDGQVQPTVDGTALMLGITADELRDVCPSLQAADLPDHLQRRGRKRTQSARDAVGAKDVNTCVAWWAVQMWDCRIDFDGAAGKLWAVVDGEASGG